MSRNLKVRNTLDLKGHKGPTVVESYLKKKKIKAMEAEVGLKTNLRYFILNLSENTLLYKDYEDTPEIKVIHIGKDIKGFSEKLDESEKNICDWPYGFKIMTTLKNYTVFAKSNDIYLKWIEILKSFFKNFTMLDKNENSLEINYYQKFSAETEKKREKYDKLSDEDWEEDFKYIQKKNQHTIDCIETKAIQINKNNYNLPSYFNVLVTSKDKNLYQKSDYKGFIVNRPANESSFIAEGSEISNNLMNIISTKPEDGKNLIKYNLNNWHGDPDYVEESDDMPAENYPRNEYEPLPSLLEDFQNPDHRHNHMQNTIYQKSHNDSFEQNRVSRNSRVDLSREDSKLRHDIKNSRYKQIKSDNKTVDNETPQGFEIIVKIPTKVNEKSHDSSEHNSKLHMHDNNDNIKISRSEILNFIVEEENVTERENEKMNWNELNGDWKTLISCNKKIQSFIERNKKSDLILKDQLPIKQNLYDEKNMHIKKSDPTNNFTIENLNYYEDNPVLQNISNDSRLKENNLRLSLPVLKSRWKAEDIKYFSGDISTLSVNGGEKVDVKWSLMKNEGATTATTAYKIQVPEILLKDQPLGRVQKLKESLSTENQYDSPVYLGKDKSYSNDRSKLSSYLNNAMSNDSKEHNPDKDKVHYETVYQKIMKKPIIDSKSNLKNKKNVVSVPLSDFGDEEYHIKIANTVKINENTHWVDDYHMPRSNVPDIYKMKDYKSFISNENSHNKTKNINEVEYDYQQNSNEMRKIESSIIKKMNLSEEIDLNVNSNEYGSTIIIYSPQTYKKTLVKNKSVKVVQAVYGIENDFDMVVSEREDQNIDDLSDIDRYYDNVSKITKNSKLDTNEQWDSSITEKDI